MIAVIIPAHNRKNLLQEALTSLVIQTYKNFITVVVDDGSTEDLKAVTNLFEKTLHLCYIRKEKSEGAGPARQTGLEWAYSRNIEMVAFLDSDDLLYPQAIERLSYEMRHTMGDVISSQISQNKDKIDTLVPAENMTWMHGKMYRCSFLKNKEIRFDNFLKTNEDVFFNLQACLQGKMFLIEEPLYLWKRTKNSLTGEEATLKKVAGVDYITAIYLTAKKLPNEKRLINNIFNCYNYYQNIRIIDEDSLKEVSDKVKFLLNLPMVKAFQKNDKKMSKMISTIHPGDFFDHKMIWYKQSFIEWMEEFVEE